MVLTLLRSANPKRVEDWASDYGVNYPILDDVGEYGDVGIELSRDGRTPFPNLVAPGATLLIRGRDASDTEIEAALP